LPLTEDTWGNIHYGDIAEADPLTATKAKIVQGDILSTYSVTSETAEIKELLCPIALKDVRTLRCLGLNYEKYFLIPAGQELKVDMPKNQEPPSPNSPSSSSNQLPH
jgi:hypothetical protein